MPNFFIVGAARSGTTSLDRYLSQHPEIFITPKKETHFFASEDFPQCLGPGDDRLSRLLIRNEQEYAQLFADVKRARAIGESSALVPQHLRVLFVAARYLPYVGGLETHVYEVGRRLACAGINITILTTDVSGRLPKIEESDGMHIRRVRAWPAKKDYYFAPEIYRVIASRAWDLVHCQGYHNLVSPLAMLATRRADIPFVLSFHSGGDVTHLRKALRWLQWMMLRPLLIRAQKLIAVSEFEAGFFQEQLRLADRNLARAVPLESTSEEVASAMISQLHKPLIPVNVELPTWDNCASKLLELHKSILRGIPCAS